MSSSQLSEVQNYRPAVVRSLESLGIVVEYYFFDPKAEAWVRKRIRLKRMLEGVRSKRERIQMAQQVADRYNAKLRSGWLPLHESEDSRLYTPLVKLRDRFLDAKRAEGCRESTLVQYGSVTALWLRWCEDNGRSNRYSGTFLRPDAVCYMDDILSKKQRHRSYNNTIKVMRAMWQWAVEHCYAKENPFIGIKTLKKEPKIRILVDRESRQKITAYYAKTRPAMNVVCQLVFSSAIRPAEIMRIRIADVHIAEHYITIPAESAKNHHERHATLTPELEAALGLVLSKRPDGRWYLFGGNENLAPGREPLSKAYFQKSWERMRRATGLPKEMQLYSLRDSGLTELLQAGVDPLTVKQHADHHSLAMTDIYTSHENPRVTEAIYEKGPRF